MLGIIVEFVWEFALQMVWELLFELGFRSLGEAVRRRSRAHPALAMLGIALLGGFAGVLTNLVAPARLTTRMPVPGVSLVLSPLLCGGAMEWYGRWRTANGETPSWLATFWGGALFAFVMAFVRFVWVGV